MKKSITALALLGAGVCAAADLTVPAGQVYTVSPAQSDLRLDRLSLGDNAQIRFAEGVARWRVEAKHVSVGNNVLIDGRGAAGAAGQKGADTPGRARDCEQGLAGGAGGAGGNGGSGVSLVFWWGIDALGSVKLLTDGGSGAAGAAGGRGQDAGRANLCPGPGGGSGGAGGAGGAGGKGGDVVLNYFDANGKGLPSLNDRLTISSVGGRSAVGGAGGTGGAGSEGRFQRTPAGDRWFRGGEPGGTGASGAAGAGGGAGAVDVQAVAANSGPGWALEAGSNAPADRGTVVSLQQQVQALRAQNSVPASVDGAVEQQLRMLQEQIKKLDARVKALEAR